MKKITPCKNCGGARSTYQTFDKRSGKFLGKLITVARCPCCARQAVQRLRVKRGGAAAHRNLDKQKFPEKYRARKAVEYAIKAGNIRRGVCVVCGLTNTQGHHEDYSKKLEVLWLCPQHHKARHKKYETT